MLSGNAIPTPFAPLQPTNSLVDRVPDQYSIVLEFPKTVPLVSEKQVLLLFCTLAKISDEVILTLWERLLMDHCSYPCSKENMFVFNLCMPCTMLEVSQAKVNPIPICANSDFISSKVLFYFGHCKVL